MTENEFQELRKKLRKQFRACKRAYASDLKSLERVWWIANNREPPAPEGTLSRFRSPATVQDVIVAHVARINGRLASASASPDGGIGRGAITEAVKDAVNKYRRDRFTYHDILQYVEAKGLKPRTRTIMNILKRMHEEDHSLEVILHGAGKRATIYEVAENAQIGTGN